MASTTSVDRTLEFREAVKAERVGSAAPRSPAPPSPDAWTLQASQVATNLRSFNDFLTSIRRPYLDLGGSHHGGGGGGATSRGQVNQRGTTLVEQWQGVKWLSDKERDEIDFSVKVALRKSVERVRQLEQLEQVRISNEKRQTATSPSRGFSKLFSTSSSSSSPSLSTSEILTSHRSYITLYLNQLLQKVSERQRLQQETRVRRQLDKTSSLGGFGGGDAIGMQRLGEKMAQSAQSDYNSKRNSRAGGGGGGGGGGQYESIYSPSSNHELYRDQDHDDEEEEEEEEEDGLDQLGRELTQEQIQQFEAEESLLLQSTRNDLESLKTAESSLLEISSLQSQLAVHLSQQSELTDQLWNEAVEVSGRVGDGNLQLKKAKERGKDSRVWLLVFLFGSSFTLLFLDYYSS